MSPYLRPVFASAATIGDMAELNERMPYRMAFPGALGTGIIVQTSQPDPDSERMCTFIDGYEAALSRFRADSTVRAMSQATHGGHFDFPIGRPACSISTTCCSTRRRGRSTRAWART